jgi:hypothetical protein
MTEIKDILHIKKNHNFKILILPEGRKVCFEKECLETVTILRKVGDQGLAGNIKYKNKRSLPR